MLKKKNKKNLHSFTGLVFQKYADAVLLNVYYGARPDARACGDTETNEVSLASWPHGLIGKTKRHKTNSNAM